MIAVKVADQRYRLVFEHMALNFPRIQMRAW